MDAWLSTNSVPFLASTDQDHANRSDSYGAMALIFSPDGILLHLRDNKAGIPHPGCWSLFGGGLEPGEDPYQAIMRELHEELNVIVTDCQPLCLLVDAEGDRRLLTIFRASTPMRTAELSLAEGRAVGAFTLPEALRLNLAPFCRRVLQSLMGQSDDRHN
jgi:8-oxo-dGTP diphosphatase